MQTSPKPRPESVEVLIVEDSNTQAEKLRYLIAGKGYQVRIAGNGRIALDAMLERVPDIVLSDIVMPEMDGYQLCQAIKINPQWQHVPVILVTSLTDSKDIIRGLECGADNFIRKPYSEDYLLTRIDHVLMNQQLRKTKNMEIGIALYLSGQKHFINSERQQILDLLISTYEQAVLVNDELQSRERQVIELNMRLAQHAARLEETNREIARQNVQLGHASRMKSEFLANMSHELRTPLNAIIGFSQALKTGLVGEMSDKQVECASDILDSGHHLRSLIEDILDLSKIEAGKMELDLEPTDIKHLLQNSWIVLKEKALAHNIKFQLEVDDTDWVMADQRKTRQILYNLLSNAVKFTPNGGTVMLGMQRVDRRRLQQAQLVGAYRGYDDGVPAAASYLELTVRDSGIGISQEDIARLFQPFVQLDSGLARKYEGSGLGLALVKQLVELHGGALSLTSVPQQGSEFTVWLPYLEAAAPSAKPAE